MVTVVKIVANCTDLLFTTDVWAELIAQENPDQWSAACEGL